MTHYELLGISPDARREEIKHAYRKRALQTHPDLRKGWRADIKRAGRQFVRISKAYKTLIDPQQRAKYDERLHERAVAAAAATAAVPRGPVHRTGRIVPPTPPAPAEPARVREDLREVDRLRRQIWKEPRDVLVRRLGFGLLLLVGLAVGGLVMPEDWDAHRLVIRLIFYAAVAVAYRAWLRFTRLWTGDGLVAMLSTDRRRHRRRRGRIPDWVNPIWLLGIVGLLGVAGISIMTIVEFEEVESTMFPASVFVLVASFVAVVVLVRRAFARS